MSYWKPTGIRSRSTRYRQVPRGSDGRPQLVFSPGILKGTGGGRSLLLNGHTDFHSSGRRRGLDRRSLVGAHQNGPLWVADPRHESRASRFSILAYHISRNSELTPKCDVMINVVIDEEVVVTANARKTRSPGLQSRRRHFWARPATSSVAGLRWPHLVRDRDSWHAGREPEALRGVSGLDLSATNRQSGH